MYGKEVYKSYGIDEGTVATYGFVSATNYWGQIIRATRRDFLTELGKSIQSPRFVLNGNYNRKIGKTLY